jgi:hypothetical protein
VWYNLARVGVTSEYSESFSVPGIVAYTCCPESCRQGAGVCPVHTPHICIWCPCWALNFVSSSYTLLRRTVRNHLIFFTVMAIDGVHIYTANKRPLIASSTITCIIYRVKLFFKLLQNDRAGPATKERGSFDACPGPAASLGCTQSSVMHAEAAANKPFVQSQSHVDSAAETWT